MTLVLLPLAGRWRCCVRAACFALPLASWAGGFVPSSSRVLAAPLPAAPAPSAQDLDPFVITATRTPVRAGEAGSVVDRLSADELARRQVSGFSGALSLLGLPVFSSGQPGASTAIFLRGANSNQTLFLVDGLRFNDPNTDYAVFLGGACVSACDSLEVAHGPQSTLYGGEAVGGVVSLRSERGEGPVRQRAALEAGSFGTWQSAWSAQGAPGPWAFNVAVQAGSTENDRPNNAFRSGNLTARLDRAVSSRVAVGATVRGFEGRYGSPGTRFTNDPDNEERESNWLATAFTRLRWGDAGSSHLVFGGQARRFESENPSPGRPTQLTVVKNRRAVLDWQNTYAGWADHRVTFGTTAEANHTLNTGFGAIDRSQSLLAFFLQDEFQPHERLHLTAGARLDDFDTFGRHATGRVTAAWVAVPSALKLRASWGTAFRSPSFLDLYGVSAFYVGNRALRPERARGGDVGADLYLARGAVTLGVTLFDNRFTDLIVSDFSRSPSSVANVGKAMTRGVEFIGRARGASGLDARFTYTYLEAENRITGQPLLRRPRHSAAVDVLRDVQVRLTLGVGVRIVSDRQDVHARTFATIAGEDFSVVRLHAQWRLAPRWQLRGRIENALNERYEEIHGFPQPPWGAFVGLEREW